MLNGDEDMVIINVKGSAVKGRRRRRRRRCSI